MAKGRKRGTRLKGTNQGRIVTIKGRKHKQKTRIKENNKKNIRYIVTHTYRVWVRSGWVRDSDQTVIGAAAAVVVTEVVAAPTNDNRIDQRRGREREGG